MAELNYRKGLGEMPSYDVVEREWDIKVNANECGFNLPPHVNERVLNRLSRVAFNRYPNEEFDDLRQQIADNYGLTKENVLLGNGSSEIIEKLFHCFGGEGHKIVYPQPSFSMYKIYVKAAEAEGIPIDLEADYNLDKEKFVKVVNDSKADLAVICNPNNPTGNLMSLSDVEYIAGHIDCAFLVDEAYIDFCGESATAVLAKYPKMIVARTFSKAFGLASCRVGYMLAAKEIMEMIGKAFMPYHMSVPALVIADIVYQMRDEFNAHIDLMVAERARLTDELAKLPEFEVYPSVTNFLLVKYADAVGLNSYLENLSIGIRSFGAAPRLENCLRITAGTPEENDVILQKIKEYVGGKS